jgi:putative flippase GtrA
MSGLADAVARLNEKHGEKLRYLVVGTWNTLFSLVLFNVLLLVFGRSLYLMWFWVVWVIAVGQSTVTMKYFAFRSKGRLLPQVGRAFVIYLPAQGLSTAIMWLEVESFHVLPQVAQIITIVVSTIFSYFGHKYFTFRLPLEVGEVPPEDMLTGPNRP